MIGSPLLELRMFKHFSGVALCVVVLSSFGLGHAAWAERVLNICVSSTDVKTIVEAVGGDEVSVTYFVKGPDDPHVVEPTRRMIQALAAADLLVIVGNAMEIGWLPDMVEQVGRAELMPGGERKLDLSVNLRTIAGPEGRGVPGSFHPEDNPHFLVDGVEGVKAAAAIRAKLTEIYPEQADYFEANFRAFASEVMTLMLGEALASRHEAEEFEELAIAVERDELAAHLVQHGGEELELGGTLAALEPYRDMKVIGDHDLWPYVARRYGVRVLGYMEPEPGVPPTAPHLAKLIGEMKQYGVRVILTVAYFDPRHAAFVQEQVDGIIVPMAHNPESRPGTDTYLDMLRYNSSALLAALEQAGSEPAAVTP
ncbi:MAG: metal ABC transporter substrate-binding protein [Planctomycetota bacterium]